MLRVASSRPLPSSSYSSRSEKDVGAVRNPHTHINSRPSCSPIRVVSTTRGRSRKAILSRHACAFHPHTVAILFTRRPQDSPVACGNKRSWYRSTNPLLLRWFLPTAAVYRNRRSPKYRGKTRNLSCTSDDSQRFATDPSSRGFPKSRGALLHVSKPCCQAP